MKESKKERVVLSGQIRIPEQVAQEIGIEAAQRNLFLYQLLLEMWEAYKESKNSPKELGSQPETGTGTVRVQPVDRVHSDPTGHVVAASPTESACMARLIRILRSPKPYLTDTAVAVLCQLEELAVLYERSPSSSNPALPEHGEAKDKAQQATGGDEAVDAIKRAAGGIRDRAAGVRGRLEKPASRGGAAGAGQARTEHPARKRG